MNAQTQRPAPFTPEEARRRMLENCQHRLAEIEAEEIADRQRLQQAALQEAAERQRRINRENARKSTGPRTEAGKTASSRNRLAHGLCSSSLLVFGETQAEFDALHEQILSTYKPVTAEEQLLTSQLTEALWRLNRARRVEAKAFDLMMDLTDREISQNGAFETDESTEAQLAVCFFDDVNTKTLSTLQRYVTANERSYRQALKAVQDAIKQRPAPAPQPVLEKPKAAAAGQALLPEIGFEPQFVPNRPENAPTYTDRC